MSDDSPTSSHLPPPPPAEAQIDPSAVHELIRLAIPSVTATTSYTLMQFADKWMVSKIGPDPVYVGSQGSGGMAAWIPISIMYGVLSIVNTFVAQNLGAGKASRSAAYGWNAIWLSVAAAVLMLPYGFAMPWLFESMGYDAVRVELASQYGQIMVFGAVLSMLARSIGQVFYGLQRPQVVMVASVTGNLTNLFFNWLLIYGHWGMPRLELQGAAIATLIGSLVEFAIPMVIFLGPKMNASMQTRSHWRLSASHIKEMLSLGWPAGAMMGTEMICWGFFMLKLVSSQSPEANTAAFIAQQWMSLSFMPAVGIGAAVASTVGKYMGMHRPDLAAKRAMVGLRLAMLYMGTCAVLFVLLRKELVEIFIPADAGEVERELVLEYGGKFLIATATFQVFDAIAMTISGALRGAGDTVYLGVITVILATTLMVGGGLAMTHWFPQLGPLGPWIAASAYIIALAIMSWLRYAGGKWRRMTVVHGQ